VPVTYVDMRSIAPSPPAFMAAAGGGEERRVLFLDTYEVGGAIDGWLRERFLPELPSEAIVVIAGRDPPAHERREDSGWCDLLRAVSLRNLDPDDARAYLRVEGVPESQHEAALAATHGHPRALRLLVERARPALGPGRARRGARRGARCSIGSSPTRRARATTRRPTSARMPVPPPRTCWPTRSAPANQGQPPPEPRPRRHRNGSLVKPGAKRAPHIDHEQQPPNPYGPRPGVKHLCN
jgi:hypothetical protein